MALNVTIDFTSDDQSSPTAPKISTVTRYDLRSAMSELFEVTLEMHIFDAALDMGTVVGERVVVGFRDEPFWFKLEGLVREARQITSEPGFASVYELVVVPELWLSTRQKAQRIFQNADVPAIVDQVIAGYGGRIAEETASHLTREHPIREYCVQYDETDHEFMSRILAEEGIATYFDHAQSKATPTATDAWTLIDDTTVDKPAFEVRFVPRSGLTTAQALAEGHSDPHVSKIVTRSRIETSRVSLRDYNYENPAVVLKGTAAPKEKPFSNEAELEAYDYEVGKFTSEERGDALARTRLEARRAMHRVFHCETSFALAPGTRFRVTGSPWGDLDLLVVRATTVARFHQSTSTSDISHELECIPGESVPFRPERRPKTRIFGTQTAFVVGKQINVDEIDVDAHGRVKVHFNWDRRVSSFEGKPTRFIRVSHAWAGQGYGMVLLPRVGDEVVVAYLDGNPDEPIIVGRVHNAVYTTPLHLNDPDQHTVSTWKSRSSPKDKGSDEDRYNLVQMQDKAGAELLQLRAQRDFRHDTLHNSTITVGGAQSTSAGSISMSSGSTISMDAATAFKMNAGTTMSMHAVDDLSARSDGTMSAMSAARMDIGAGGELHVGSEALIALDAPTITINGHAIASVHGGGKLFLHGGDVWLTANGEIRIRAAKVSIEAGTVSVEAAGDVDVNGASVNLNC